MRRSRCWFPCRCSLAEDAPAEDVPVVDVGSAELPRRRGDLWRGQRDRQRDVRQLDDIGRVHHGSLARRRADDARRRLELGDGELVPRRCALCSRDSWCCNDDRRTCPLASSACATTTASSAATIIDTDTMLSIRPRFPNSRRRCVRAKAFGPIRDGTSASGAQRRDGTASTTGVAASWRSRRRGRWCHQSSIRADDGAEAGPPRPAGSAATSDAVAFRAPRKMRR